MGRYKKITLIFCFLCLMFTGAITPSLAKDRTSEIEKLPKIVHVLKNEGASITSWQLYAREDNNQLVSMAQVNKEVQRLKKLFPNDHWSAEKEEMDVRYVGELQNQQTQTIETITLLAYPRKNAYQTYLIYVVSGSKWEERTWSNKISKTALTNLNLIFGHANKKIFACTTGVLGDKMDVRLSKKSNEILNDLKARPVEADQEKTFISVSAYTELWNESITSNGNPINVQLGLRQVSHQTTVTLGTPIITTEY